MAVDKIKTTPTERSKETPQNLRFYRSKSRPTVVSRRDRGSGRESLFKSTFRSTEERLRREEAGIRYKLFKQVHKGPQIPHGINEASTPSSKEKGVRRFHRSQGRLLARANSSTLSKVLSVRCPRTTVRIQSHAIWTKPGTSRLHQANEGSSNQATRSRSGGNYVPRRLAHNCELRGRMRRDGKEDARNRKNYGITVQHEEIQARSHNIDGMVGVDLEHRARDCVPVPGQPKSMHAEDPEGQLFNHALTQTVGEFGGIPEPCRRSSPPRSHSHAQIDLRRTENLHIQQPRPSSSIPQENPETTEMVDKVTSGIRSQMDSRPGLDNADHRCVGRGMGLPNIGGPSRSRIVEKQEQEGSHQCERIKSGPNCSSPRIRSEQSLHPCSVRQHIGGPLYQQTRNLQVPQPSKDIGETVPSCEDEETPFIGFAPTGKDEFMVRRALEEFHRIRRVVVERGSVSESDEEVWSTGDRSVCDESESEAPPISDKNRKNLSRRTRCHDRKLEQVELHLPVPPSIHNPHAPDNAATPELQGSSVTHCTTVESATLGTNAPPGVSDASSSAGTSAQRHNRLGIREIIGSSRVEFLKLALGRSLPEETVRDIVLGLRSSTTRQYESSWKKFQKFLEEMKYEKISAETVLEFASYLFHKRKLAISTISGHISAIADPLKFAFDIPTDSRSLDLMKSSFFLQRPPARKAPPSWSIQKVLDHLSSDQYTENASPDNLLKKALFLVALASGLRVSQLRALTRSENLTKFAPDSSQVTLAPNPKFIAKNERLHHRMKPVMVPALIEGERPHSLCPVVALRKYMREVVGDDENLWIWPRTQQAMSTAQVAKLIRQVIEEADPGKAPMAHDVRGCASSLAFGRSLDPYQVQLAGQWASCSTFVNRYLFPRVTESHCVAMGSLPA